MRLVIPPPVQGLIIGAAMWALARFTPGLSFSYPGMDAVAGVLIVLGVAIEVIAVAAFWRARTTINPMTPDKANQLVVSGLFRFSRNPMYLSLVFILGGWALWLGNPLNAALLIGFVLYITRFQIEPEEAALREKFGDDFEAYAARVRRWL